MIESVSALRALPDIYFLNCNFEVCNNSKGVPMQKPLVKFAAYVIIILGILLAAANIIGAIVLFIVFPEGNMTKLSLVAAGLVILGIILGIVGYAIFEALMETTRIEEEIPQNKLEKN